MKILSVFSVLVALLALLSQEIFAVDITENAVVASESYSIDPSVTSQSIPISGHWHNSGESGWGINLTQQGITIIYSLVTSDINMNPLWYVGSCEARAETCSGILYVVTGVSALTVPVDDNNKQITSVGTIDIKFTSDNSATMDYVIDGASGSKMLERYVFGVPVLPGAFCGGIAGIACPDGQTCIDDPVDSCDPDCGGADCGGICVFTGAESMCGGIADFQCPTSQVCVDTKGDDCSSECGGADCGGFCVKPPPNWSLGLNP